jgi:hypothetical protein
VPSYISKVENLLNIALETLEGKTLQETETRKWNDIQANVMWMRAQKKVLPPKVEHNESQNIARRYSVSFPSNKVLGLLRFWHCFVVVDE